MHFNKLILDKKLLYREFDSYIYKKDIIEKIFNDEIIFNLIALSKTEVTDIESFFISAMGAIGLDELDITNCLLIEIDEYLMHKEIDVFQKYWKLNLEFSNYVKGKIKHIYEVNLNIDREKYFSEIDFIIETNESYIYFSTSHFYY